MSAYHHNNDVSIEEKASTGEHQKVSVLDDELLSNEANGSITEGQRKEERRVTQIVDWRLLPILAACYTISGIDRINISSARIAGMDTELGFNQGSRYSISLLVFFITYFIFEIPSNIVLRKVGAANWLSFLVFAWGAVVLGAGFAKKWTDIVVCRLLLGLFEAGFFPGCVYLISCWYTRYEVQKRIAIFYSIAVFSTGFGSLLAYGITQLHGKHGYLGWRWIFIINGAMTIFLAVLGRILIVDFPDKIHKSRRPFLKPEQVRLVQGKVHRDRQDAEFDPLTQKKFWKALAKWELWVYALQFFATTTGSYALAYFLPTILRGMGYSRGMAFLLSAPPSIAAVPWIIFSSWMADKTRLRAPYIISQAVLVIIGLMIVAYAKHHGARYFGVFLGMAGANANTPATIAWQANNIRGQSLRMVASAMQVGFGAIGGIYASTVFMQKEAPTYRTGLWAVTGVQFFIIFSAIGLVWYYLGQNKKADRNEVILEGLEGFRYTY